MQMLDDANMIRDAAIQAVDPYKAVTLFLKTHHQTFDTNEIDVVAVGKAAIPMISAFVDATTNVQSGIVVTNKGQTDKIKKKSTFYVYESDHPVPSDASIHAGKKILTFLEHSSASHIVFLISGGGSSLITVPASDDISLQDIRILTQRLLECGAPIHKINTIRKHIDSVKGGGLLQKIHRNIQVTSLILSDVIGDDLSVIASGPTFWDNSTYKEALQILASYGIDDIPNSIRTHLVKGLEGKVPETLKQTDKIFRNCSQYLIGNLSLALTAAKKKSEELGYHTIILSSDKQGEAKEVGKYLSSHVVGHQNKKPVCLLIGGETTVTLNRTGNGTGGRNQELVLSAGLHDSIPDNVLFYSFGTDGIDGPTDAAGAWITNELLQKAEQSNIQPLHYLLEHDAYTFFKATGGLIHTGPTGTNVGDITLALIR